MWNNVPLDQTHSLHAIVHIPIGRVEDASCRFYTSGDKCHNDLCFGYFYKLFHAVD